MAMSGPSLSNTSGKFAFGAGLICLVLSGVLWYWTGPTSGRGRIMEKVLKTENV